MKSEKNQPSNDEKKPSGAPKKPKPKSPESRLAPGIRGDNMLPYPTDPPVPNRAWTEMRLGRDIDTLSEEEKADLYLGRDKYLN